MKGIFVFFFFNRQKSALSQIGFKLNLNTNIAHDSKSGCFHTVKRVGAYSEGVCSLIISPLFVRQDRFFFFFPPVVREAAALLSASVTWWKRHMRLVFIAQVTSHPVLLLLQKKRHKLKHILAVLERVI